MQKSHVIIAGTGRAGTTLLVQLFTELGLDTGFSKDEFDTEIDSESHGGLEFDLQSLANKNPPRVIKSPYFYKFADEMLKNSDFLIDHIFIPVRKLEHAAQSRIRVQTTAEEKSHRKIKSDEVAGGLTGTESKESQEVILGRQLTSLIKSVSKSGVPHSFLAFPTFAQNPSYLYENIKFLIPSTPFEVFLEIFESVVDLSFIHNFQEQFNSEYDISNYESLLNEISHDQYLFDVDDYMPSARIGHAPFMKFIIREFKPRTFVELGVHNGFSYFVGCQAIKECGLSSKAFAIDHWEGDSQAGFFDDSVYCSVREVNSKYDDFSTLIKSSFSDALKNFKEESIDLLHIDGFHSYESVKRDFQTWRPKMSKDGVILLHDIHVRRNTFGVYIFWQEVKEKFRTIEFVGSHGLGVVFLGEVPAGKLSNLFQMSENGHQDQIRGTFGSISDDVIQTFRMRGSAVAERYMTVAERDSALAERDSALAERDSVLNSTIWKISKPYRWLRGKI